MVNLSLSPISEQTEPEQRLSPEAALEELLAGNRRFTSGRTSAHRRDLAMLQQTAGEAGALCLVLSPAPTRACPSRWCLTRPSDSSS